MHYFSFHIRDYRSKTGYLTRMQNLAYRLLLEECYMTERPLPSDPAECARKIGMSDCVDDVRLVLNDFFELGELMCIDALHRRESCGGHFRAESQTEEGEALRHDDEFLYVAAWEWTGEGNKPILHREPLIYKAIELKQRSYK